MPKQSKTTSSHNDSAFKHMFGREHLQRIAAAISQCYPEFNSKQLTKIYTELVKREMKHRVHLIRDTLKAELPEAFPDALKILLKSVECGDLKGFDLWPYTEYIQTYGLEYPKLSLDALKKLTTRFTSEWAVRPFLRKDTATTLDYLVTCAESSNVHVRRWASEGSRPRLPWGERLGHFIENPDLTLKILEILKYDDELYVRKSVANHLNDISKDHPEVVLKVLARWKRTVPALHRGKIDWIISHALRTLIKQGDPSALRLIDVSIDAQIKLEGFEIKKRSFRLGERIEFSLTLKSLSKTPQNLVIDYIIHFTRANKTRSPKVFKLKKLVISPSEKIEIKKSHHLKEVTTRSHYPGEHLLEIQVNGLVLKRCLWLLAS